MLKKSLIVSVCILVSACVSTPPFAVSPAGETAVVVPAAGALPAPMSADTLAGNRPYLIGSNDALIVDVFGVEGLQGREVRVDSGGLLSFPLAGTMDAAGKSPADLADEIRQRLSAYIRDPQVTVSLKEAVSQRVTVDGQVREPGVYPIASGATLMTAIATANGVGEFAKLDDVVIFRTVGGQRMAGLYNLGAIRRGYYADPEVYPQDVIIVGDSPARRWFRDVLQVAPLLTSPVIVALQNAR